MEFYTIGVYNSTEGEYFNKLINNRIDTFCDIRQRRGVRGAEYKFVNSKYLQSRLNELGINYIYIPELAPTAEIRKLQKDADLKSGILKRDRTQMGKVFVDTYLKTIADSFDFKQCIAELIEAGANRVVLFCVEEKPEACHRSIVGNEIARFGFKITDL